MTSRSFLAIVLCPVLGLLAGSWVSAMLLPWALKRMAYAAPEGAVALLPYVLVGATVGLLVGLLWSAILIWLFARGAGSPQRALADLVTIGLAIMALIDGLSAMWVIPFDRTAAWRGLWAATAAVWMLGLVLSFAAFRRARRLQAAARSARPPKDSADDQQRD